MIRLLVLICLIYANFLQGDLEDHFKEALGKSDLYSMRNIDFIYIINLDQRPEKFASCLQQLEPYNIHPYRFSAVNGWELSLEEINDVGIILGPWMSNGQWGTCYLPNEDSQPYHELVYQIGRTYFSHCMSRGAIGIVLSHLSVLQDAYDAGYETIWVMEDDISVIENPLMLSSLIDDLDAHVGHAGWDILFTDRDTKNSFGNYVPCTAYAWRPNYSPPNPHKFYDIQEISPQFRKIGARYGAYSMIVRRSGMKKLLNFFKQYQIFLPYDLEYTLPPGINLYTVNLDVVSTLPNALSDNGGPNYKIVNQQH